MSFENSKVRETNGLDKQEPEETGGLSMSPPAFSVSASPEPPPIQRQTLEGANPEGGETATPVSLTREQITAATSQNSFLLEESAAINAFQTAIGATVSGAFDEPTISAIATYQSTNNIESTPGTINQATLDSAVRALVTAGNQVGAAAIARDFFQLDKRAVPVAVTYNASLAESAQLDQTNANSPVLNLGPTAFTNGLTGLGTALDTAMGAGTSIANQSWGVLEAGTRTERQNAMWSDPNAANEAGLAVWVRENFPTEDTIRTYMSRTDITDEAKIATLGLLAAELGRLEFLMGVIWHGGTDQSWESAGENRGPFVNNFKSEVGNGVNGSAWCTMFAGYLRRMLGFSEELSARGPLIFNAGMRLDHWATSGRNLLSGVDDFDDPSDYADYTGDSIDTNIWIAHRRALRRNGITAQERQELTDTLMTDHFTPQAGDIMIINLGTTTNAYSGSSSHTVNVESFSGYTISTIEGNRGNKVTGTTIDLSDPDDVAQIIMLTRIGTEFYPQNEPAPEGQEGGQQDAQQPAAEGGAQQAEAPAAPQVTQESMLGPLQAMTRQLQLLAHRREYVSSDAAGASVATMAGPNNTGGQN